MAEKVATSTSDPRMNYLNREAWEELNICRDRLAEASGGPVSLSETLLSIVDALPFVGAVEDDRGVTQSWTYEQQTVAMVDALLEIREG